MIGLGTIVNSAAIIVGCLAGLIAKKGLPERFKNTIMQALSLSVIIIGISGALQGIFQLNKNGRLDRAYIMTMIFSLVVGGIIGEAIDIERQLDRLGNRLQKRLSGDHGTFAEGFVTATLVYCVGAMAIVGSLEDGLTRNVSTLFSKSILDGISAIIFTSMFGIGVGFSAVSVFVYQGLITVLAGFIKPWLADVVVVQMSLVGSVIIIAVGANMLNVIKFKAGNLLPAMFMPLAYYIVKTVIGF